VLSDTTIGIEELSDAVRQGALEALPRPQGLDLRSHVDDLERRLVAIALERSSGNQTRAAELLGVSRFGLQKMLKRLNIRVTDFPNASSTERVASRAISTGDKAV
jgi:transcriptional regulator with GAF, ATPase, and Fis domain